MMRRILLVAVLALGLGVLAGFAVSVLVRGDPAPDADPATKATASGRPQGETRGPRESAGGADPQASAPEPAAPVDAGAISAWGTLMVLVMDGGSGQPLPRQRLFLDTVPRTADMSWTGVDSARAAWGEAPHTDQEGRAELQAPADRILVLSNAWDDPHAEHAELHVEALAEGQRREIHFALAVERDFSFHGHVVSAADGAPVSDARVHDLSSIARGAPPEHADVPQAVSLDAQGSFQLTAAPRARRTLCLHAPGYSLATVGLTAGHDTPEQARTIELLAAASLEVFLARADSGPVAGLEVAVSIPSGALERGEGPLRGVDSTDLTWTAATSSNGTCLFVDLPAESPLQLEVRDGGRVVLRERTPVRLAPGEERALELTIGVGTRVIGELVDQLGKPLGGRPIWLLSATEDVPHYLRPHELDDDRPALLARTTESGGFEFERVPAGLWWIGPAPSPESSGNGAATTAALAVPVRIGPEDLLRHIRVVAQRGIAIRGRVIDEKGNPVPGIHVSARALEAQGFFDGVSASDGGFSLGPLATGAFQLRAGGYAPSPWAPSEPVTVAAGASRVELRVGRAGTLRGRLSAREGRVIGQAELMISLRARGQPPAPLFTLAPVEEEFALEGLAPGTYSVCARSIGGLVGVLSGIELKEGGQRDDLLIELAPGARLRVRVAAQQEAGTRCLVWLGDACVYEQRVQADIALMTRVPPGRFAVELVSADQRQLAERELDLAVGEDREIVLP